MTGPRINRKPLLITLPIGAAVWGGIGFLIWVLLT